MPYYAVKVGRVSGIYTNWNDCKKNTYGYRGAIYKKFDTIDEAKLFINDNSLIGNQIVDDNYDFSNCINIYTDGGCINNGKKNAKASIGIFFSEDDKRNESRKLKSNGIHKLTNNRAELKAILVALSKVVDEIKINKIIVIHTDSSYSIKAFTTDFTQKRNEDEIPNIDYIKKGYNIIKKYPNIKFHYVKAHTDATDIHSIGNYNADQLASFALQS
jgi:ribonuclease HI